MALLDDIKLSLRITNTAYDTEINDLILQVKADLASVGIIEAKIVETDPIIKRAILVFCRANFGLNNPDSEKLQKCYESIRDHLSMSLDYSYYKVTLNAGTQELVMFDGEYWQTDDKGIAIFYTRKQNHVPYCMNGVDGYIDITADTTIGA